MSQKHVSNASHYQKELKEYMQRVKDAKEEGNQLLSNKSIIFMGLIN